MSQELRAIGKRNSVALPALFAPDAKTAEKVLEFFTARIRNKNARRAYAKATGNLAAGARNTG